jgi:hypothetical protein
VTAAIDPTLLAVARAGLPGAAPPPRDGWEGHLDAVLTQGLAGLFAASASVGMVRIDADMAGRLQRQLDAEAVRAVQLEGELLRLAPALEYLGGVVLKGAVLAHGAYPDPLLRPFTDIDLLVPGERIENAISVLGTYGYQRARPEPAPGYDARVGKAVVLQHPGGVIIDLHRTLAAGDAGEAIDVHEIVAGRQQVPVGPHTVGAPSWEAHLVECALHAVVGDGLTRPLSLRDIAEVAHHPLLDAAVAADLAYRWQVAELVGLGLGAARDGLGLELPDALADLAHRADTGIPASEPARSARLRLDELRSGDLRRQATLARSLVAPSPEFLHWAHGDGSLARLYGRRWRSLYQRALDARHDEPAVGPEPTAHTANLNGGNGLLPALPERYTGPPPPADPPSSGRPLPVLSRQPAAMLERPTTISRQEAWSRARPARQRPAPKNNGRSPSSAGGGGGHAHSNGQKRDADDDGSGPPDASDGSPTSEPAPNPGAAPARNGLAYGIAGGALLTVTAIGSQVGNNNLGVVLVPAAGLLLAAAASRRIARLRPDEAWVGRWLVLAVVVKLVASYYRYHTAFVTYGGVADASGYDNFGRQFAEAWLNGGSPPELGNLRLLNFMRWFTGVVYYVFGINMVTGFFVFGLLAVVGSYFWYRAAVDAVPRLDKRLALGLALFAPSVTFWPSSIGKESLMQLGIGTVALATSRLLRHRLASAAVIGAAGGWLLWVVRPHLLALVTLAGGCAYAAGRVRGAGGTVRTLMARPVGLLAVVLAVAFTLSQMTKFLGMEDLSLSSIEAELEENTERSAIGESTFDNGGGGSALNPLRLPQGAVTVLVRPFPWETDGALQLLASLESAALTALVVTRLGSLRAALIRARSTPFLLYAWVFVILYAATFSSIANFGLLVRQRSLVLPALFVLLAVRSEAADRRPRATPSRQFAMTGGARGA